MMFILSVLLQAVIVDSYSFMSLGDWGGANISPQVKDNVYAVAKAMEDKANGEKNYPSFLVNTGDNFYWCGITDTEDSQINTDFVEPYAGLNLDFYGVLGNHEYGYNVSAQLEYATMNSKWIMDDRYYSRRILLDEALEVYASMIFLDTSPCVAGYRESNPENWDPCSNQYPTCSPGATDDDFEGPCMFHENILTQNCTAQHEWFRNTINAVPENDWLIVVGHHPIDEVNMFDYTDTLQKHGFSIYLNGHAHTLSQYKIDDKGLYFTSGAGSLVNTNDQEHDMVKAKLRGEKYVSVDGTLLSGDTEADSGLSNHKFNHTYTTVFNQKVAGFTYHYFDSAFTTLTSEIVSYTGEIIHSVTTKKDGTYV